MNATTHSEQETKQIAAEFAAELRGGEVVFLHGDLGSGKTTFVRGVAQALGFVEPVRSPTFTIVNRYPVARGEIKQILHVDLYRIDDPAELAPLALEEEVGQPDTITFIEWPDIVSHYSKPSHRIDLTVVLEGRCISINRSH